MPVYSAQYMRLAIACVLCASQTFGTEPCIPTDMFWKKELLKLGVADGIDATVLKDAGLGF